MLQPTLCGLCARTAKASSCLVVLAGRPHYCELTSQRVAVGIATCAALHRRSRRKRGRRLPRGGRLSLESRNLQGGLCGRRRRGAVA